VICVIVPDSLRAAINQKLDAAFVAVPDARKERDALFLALLRYFNEHGELPEFTLEKKEQT